MERRFSTQTSRVGTLRALKICKACFNALAFNIDVSDWSVSESATTIDMFTGSAFVTSRSDLAVTVSNDGATTSDEEFALGVSVSATACSSSCDLSEGGTSTDGRAEGGFIAL